MNKGIEEFMRKQAEDQANKQAERDARPTVEAQFQKDYSQKALLLKSLIDKFNSDAVSKGLKMQLRLDGPDYRNDIETYLLRTTGGIGYPGGKLLQLNFPGYFRFEGIEIDVKVWQDNLDLSSLRNNLSSFPDEWKPKLTGSETYKLIQIGLTYGWKTSSKEALSFEELFDYFIERLIKINYVASK